MMFVVVLCGISWLAAGIFWIYSRKQCGSESRKRFFERLAEGILSFPTATKLYSSQVKQYLRELYPAKEINEICRCFYRDKLAFVLKLWFAGIHFILLVTACEQAGSLLREGSILERGSIGETEQKVLLQVYTEENGIRVKEDISYDVYAQMYAPEDIREFTDRFLKEYEIQIRGENTSLQEVRTALLLRESYDSYPMEFSWESSDGSLLDEEGNVFNGELEAPQLVTLTVRINYEDETYEHSFAVRICPKEATEKELWHKEILTAIQNADKEQKYTDILRLPDKIAGKSVVYKLPRETSSVMCLLFLVFIVVLLFYAKDNDLKKETESRKRKLSLKYPEFVSKFQLLLGAGMTVRNICLKLSEDASLGEELDWELEFLIRDMKNGLSVREALDRFGKRTAHPLYMKFAALLTQNLKKGTGDLLSQLSGEAAEAFTLKKTHARQLGEEAGTKLLGPMILMLAIVMAVLMIPAFLSFQL